MFSEAELERLRRFPREVSQEELVRFFMLTSADDPPQSPGWGKRLLLLEFSWNL